MDGDFYLPVLFFFFFFFLIIVLRANIETIEVKRRNLFLKIVECTRNDSSENLDFSGNIDC